MKQVTVKKSQLIEVLTKNREKHIKEYRIAFAGYQKEALETLERNHAKLKSADAEVGIPTMEFLQGSPENHQADYERAIDMLVMSVEENIVIEEAEFRQYVQDEWSWKHGWLASNFKYLAS